MRPSPSLAARPSSPAPEDPANGSRGGASRLLRALADPGSGRIPTRVAVVVAHPDDETIGCGHLLSRLAEPLIVHTSDGAPRDPPFWNPLGFTSAAEYATTRRSELVEALRTAGIGADRATGLGHPDQQVVRHLPEMIERMQELLAEVEVVVTHAYEGGHPDHDATCYAVHRAAQALRQAGSEIEVVEFPLYRAGVGEGWARQSYPEECPPDLRLELSGEHLRLKQKMYAAHRTQAAILAGFSPAVEVYRDAPAYDFHALPNGGSVLYDYQNWGIRSAEWLSLVREAEDRTTRPAA